MKEDIALREGVVPSKIVCRTWTEFLYNDLAKPYRKMVGAPKLEGLDFRQVGQIPRRSGVTSNNIFYYLNSKNQLYAERLAEFCCKTNVHTNGLVFNRLQKIYRTILIDEIQDLNGYDLDILNYIYSLICNVIMVGDNRQATYSTNHSLKNRRYRSENIFNFFRLQMGISDIESLELCYRCNQQICDFANQLFDDLNLVSGQTEKILEEDGIILLSSEERMEGYINNYLPSVLYYSKPSLRKLDSLKLNVLPESMSFGNSKGLTRDRVLILPTVEMRKHALGQNYSLAALTLAKYYVAITRATRSVAIYVGN
ncbi:DNA/RNA helicase [Bacillus canaveralius]|uniref:DNA/RNA helicase n=1 Tax=Bacillus canaveralius TaxID=1403243 RepID=A0A2N5GNF1_9BACI|nr:UvrD-helicase domain-containing protein [Bacillus canaveralius]PLR83894.1 DNA/RNA helicase [Bacillus canaveralius]PLR88424.1 DNA/RNA helicase [Bacillus canaveralius]